MAGSDVLTEFSHLRDAALKVAQLISNIRTYVTTKFETSEENLELEARLGHLRGHHFDPNVGQSAFCTILQLLEGYHRWSRISNWQETQDIFYSVELPAEFECEGPKRKTQIRTTVGIDEKGDIELLHHIKKKIQSVDMEMRVMDSGSCSVNVCRRDNNDGHDARVAASIEKSVPADLLPIAVTPDFVRIKQRKRFFLASLGIAGETFSFDLSIVYMGKTKSEAEQNQSQQLNASFEIEIECLEPHEYLKSSGGEDLMLALSLILKCHDFSSALHAANTVTYIPRD